MSEQVYFDENVGKSSEVRHLLQHLCLASVRFENQMKARSVLENQIDKTRSVALQRPKKDVIEFEFEKINRALADLRRHENFILMRQHEERKATEDVQKKIAEMEKRIQFIEQKSGAHVQENIAHLHNAVFELQNKLSSAVQAKTAHAERVKEIENKIRNKVLEKKSAVNEIRQQINTLEQKCNVLKKKNYESASLELINSKIRKLKQELNEIRAIA